MNTKIKETKKTVKIDNKMFTFKKQKSNHTEEEDEKLLHDILQKIEDEGGDFYVSGSDFGFPDVMVKTSIDYVEEGFDLLKEMNKSEIFTMLTSIHKAYKNKSSDELYKCNHKWENFCSDIVLFYCCRYMVDKDFKIPAIRHTKELDKKLNESLERF